MVDMNEVHGADAERRMHGKIREAFPDACALVAPMMPAVKQGYISDFALTHIVHDRFPDLSSEEVEILILAVKSCGAQTGTA